MGATFTHQHKVTACAAFSRGWRKAMEDKATWEHLSARGKVEFIRAKVREEIFNLPEKLSLCERIKLWANGKVS